MSSPLFRKKPISTVLHDQQDETHGQVGLRKILGVKDLTAMGIAAVIGAGIFSTIESRKALVLRNSSSDVLEAFALGMFIPSILA